MNYNGHFRRLDGTGPGVCRKHSLMIYTKVEAQIDAEAIRQAAEADTPPSRAQAGPCGNTDDWHIYIPSKARMRTLRKRARRAERRRANVPRETSPEES